jgi:hypothetical protein
MELKRILDLSVFKLLKKLLSISHVKNRKDSRKVGSTTVDLPNDPPWM